MPIRSYVVQARLTVFFFKNTFENYMLGSCVKTKQHGVNFVRMAKCNSKTAIKELLTGRTKTQFSRIRNSVTLNETKQFLQWKCQPMSPPHISNFN